MTIKKFKLFLASNIEKEEQWLTEMSRKGLHLNKYRLGTYYFEEDRQKSYVYQIDFREADDDYLQFYKDAGWQHVESFIDRFHYFRTEANRDGIKKIYSDRESVKETLQRMMRFYITFFFAMIASQIGLIVTWKGHPYKWSQRCLLDSYSCFIYISSFLLNEKSIFTEINNQSLIIKR